MGEHEPTHPSPLPIGWGEGEPLTDRLTQLFENDPAVNLLPCDGIVNYYGRILSGEEARRYYQALLTGVQWAHDEAVIFGKRIVTARQVAWYGDADYAYTYSGTTKRALEWTGEMLELKGRVEELTGTKFNSCLLNLYHDGNEGVTWHSDDEDRWAGTQPSLR